MKAWLIVMAVVASVLGAATPSAAQSPDFTITVPLRLTSLPTNVVGGTVVCTVFDNSGDIPGGSQTHPFSIDPNSGTLSRDLVFNIRTTIHPSRIDRYECRLALSRDLDGRSRAVVPPDDINRTFPNSTVIVSGPVPR